MAATSCNVCDSGRPPLWQLRARRIVHDTEERQLYFDHAQLRILGLPVLYAPRLRLPDPTLDRATGFLFPEITSSSLLGWGGKVPYFIELGESADLTVTPFITTETNTLELGYRRAYAGGEIDWNTYISDDTLSNREVRWGVLSEGRFDLPREFELNFDIEAASDRSYLSDYNYSGKDRLDSALSLSRTRTDSDTFIELVALRSLRDAEANNEFPSVIFDATHRLRLGNYGGLTTDFHSHYRESQSTDDEDGDGIADGLDLTRATALVDWKRSTVLPSGFVLEAQALAGGDLYFLSDDPGFDDSITRARGGAAIGLSWPLMHRVEGGAMNILEPKVQLSYSGASTSDVPNEDSTGVEFDEGNLFSLNRAPGSDVIEDGARVDLGLTWTRFGPQGWDSTVTFGRIERISGDNDFSASSGLSEDASNWLISGTLTTGGLIDVIGRLLLEDDLGVTKNEIGVAYGGERLRVTSSYAYLVSDPGEDRNTESSEITIDSEYDFSDVLTGSASMRYDFTTEATTEAEIGLRYVNECVEVVFSVSRNFTSSDSVNSSTDFGLTVGLLGFGTSDAASRANNASCR